MAKKKLSMSNIHDVLRLPQLVAEPARDRAQPEDLADDGGRVPAPGTLEDESTTASVPFQVTIF